MFTWPGFVSSDLSCWGSARRAIFIELPCVGDLYARGSCSVFIVFHSSTGLAVALLGGLIGAHQ